MKAKKNCGFMNPYTQSIVIASKITMHICLVFVMKIF